MAKAIFNVFFKVIKGIANIILQPVNALVVTIFPNFSNLITAFNNAIMLFLGNGIAYFFHIFPPNTRNLVIIWLTFLISYYSISFTIHGILKVYKLIKQIKIW